MAPPVRPLLRCRRRPSDQTISQTQRSRKHKGLAGRRRDENKGKRWGVKMPFVNTVMSISGSQEHGAWPLSPDTVVARRAKGFVRRDGGYVSGPLCTTLGAADGVSGANVGIASLCGGKQVHSRCCERLERAEVQSTGALLPCYRGACLFLCNRHLVDRHGQLDGRLSNSGTASKSRCSELVAVPLCMIRGAADNLI